MLKLFMAALAVTMLSGCGDKGMLDWIGFAQEKGAVGTVKLMQGECALGEKIRTGNFCAINEEAARQGLPIRATPIDCDGDGNPDPLLCEAE